MQSSLAQLKVGILASWHSEEGHSLRQLRPVQNNRWSVHSKDHHENESACAKCDHHYFSWGATSCSWLGSFFTPALKFSWRTRPPPHYHRLHTCCSRMGLLVRPRFCAAYTASLEYEVHICKAWISLVPSVNGHLVKMLCYMVFPLLRSVFFIQNQTPCDLISGTCCVSMRANWREILFLQYLINQWMLWPHVNFALFGR